MSIEFLLGVVTGFILTSVGVFLQHWISRGKKGKKPTGKILRRGGGVDEKELWKRVHMRDTFYGQKPPKK